MDSIFQLTNNEFPELIDGYQLLLKHYKKDNNIEKQLECINKIVYVDSLTKQNYINIDKNIAKNYDIPLLIKEKEGLIKKLEDEYSFYIVVLFLSILILFYFCFYLLRKNRNNKRRFKELMEEKIESEQPVLERSVIEKTSIELNISDAIVESVLKKIEKFEEKKDFLKKDLNVKDLAKKFKTNEKYLSKIINVYKEKKFIHYMNDLRIDYIIDELKNNRKLRLYTIKAIASEAGFNTSQSFSNAFQKRSGIKPSYFIDQIKKSD